MTRKLPWIQSSPMKASPRLPPMRVSTPKRRSEPNEAPSSSAKTTDIETPRKTRPRSPASSSMAPSSPVAEPVEEIFMREGIDKDDRYRMVEDELLRVAKQFTVHLHAAEYKRRQKMERERNSDMINSISRPVVGRMPDHTKRKADRVDKAKRQQTTVEVLLTNDGKQDDDDSDDSAEGLPYIGTSLHGLMDSPRKKAKSLAKLGMISASTRASAGFDRSSSRRPTSRGSIFSQSQRKSQGSQPGMVKEFRAVDESETASSEDDDLDAPVAAPKPLIKNNTSSTFYKPQPSKHTQTRSAALPGDYTPQPSHESNQSNSRVAKRVEKIRLRRVKEEEDNSKLKQKMDIIPTFL
ncbi:hypothetical protein F5884DRAFT_391395 [Xylogone sp. PMI_703]|nr:hypothetical protein F5884DRAFT_391395 [Xylogone sp. PMI_703]